MQLVATSAFNALTLTGLTGAGGALTGAKVGLTKADILPAPEVTLADVEAAEADFAGYARKAATWLAPSVSDDGKPEIVGQVPEFRPTDESVDNTAFQAFLVNAAGDELLALGTLDGAPIPMGQATDSLLVYLRVRQINGGLVQEIS